LLFQMFANINAKLAG